MECWQCLQALYIFWASSPIKAVIFLQSGLTFFLFYLWVKIAQFLFIFKQVIYRSVHFYWVGLITHFVEAVLFYNLFCKTPLHILTYIHIRDTSPGCIAGTTKNQGEIIINRIYYRHMRQRQLGKPGCKLITSSKKCQP